MPALLLIMQQSYCVKIQEKNKCLRNYNIRVLYWATDVFSYALSLNIDSAANID